MLPFRDRAEAGRLLVTKLKNYEERRDVAVVALLRGGVPVAFEIAERVKAPLDTVVVRKIGLPWQPELAIGAVASGGVRILDQGLIRSAHLSNYLVYALVEREEQKVKDREKPFLDGRDAKELSGKTVILVDDGVATGSTMLAAVESVRMQTPQQIVIAVPVASREAQRTLAREVDRFICLASPEPFLAVGNWYKFFPQVDDEEVRGFLSRSWTVRNAEAAVQISAAAQ